MKHFSRDFKESFVPDEGEKIIFPAGGGYGAAEVTYVTVTISFTPEDQTWSADIDVYGYPLTTKGGRDKRVTSGQNIFGMYNVPSRKDFLQKMVRQALSMHNLSETDLSGCEWLFE